MVFGGMAFGTKCNQIGGSIRAVRWILPKSQVMNLQNWFVCFVIAVGILAFMSVSMQDIFPQIIKAVLLSILILFPNDCGVLDFLDVKCSNFDCYRSDREGTAYLVDKSVMSI